MKKILSLALMAALCISLLTACGSKTLELNEFELNFAAAGETAQLSASKVKGELTFTSSDESVATVDANGVVTAVAPGKAVITAKAGELSDLCVVLCDWAVEVDLDTLYNDLYNELYPLDAEGFATGPVAMDLMSEESGMTAEDAAAMLEMYYPGLKDIAAEQLHVYIPGMSFSAYEVVLMELTNSADVDAVKAILQARVDAQANGGAWYPEAIEGWVNNARIVSNGNYVMLAVGADCDKFVETFNAQF